MSLPINRVTISGHVFTAPECRQTNRGRLVASFRMAVTRRTAVGDDHTSVIDVTAFDAVADSCASLQVGDNVVIDGSLVQDRWTGRDGIGRQKIVVSARRVTCLADMERPMPPPASHADQPPSESSEPSPFDRALAWLRRPRAREERTATLTSTNLCLSHPAS